MRAGGHRVRMECEPCCTERDEEEEEGGGTREVEEEEAVILSGAASAAVLSGTASARTNEGKREEGKDRDTKAGAYRRHRRRGEGRVRGVVRVRPGAARDGRGSSAATGADATNRPPRRRLRRRRLRTRNPRRSRRPRGRLPLESPRGPPNDGEGFRETRGPRSTRGVQARARRGVFGSTALRARGARLFLPTRGLPHGGIALLLSLESFPRDSFDVHRAHVLQPGRDPPPSMVVRRVIPLLQARLPGQRRRLLLLLPPHL